MKKMYSGIFVRFNNTKIIIFLSVIGLSISVFGRFERKQHKALIELNFLLT